MCIERQEIRVIMETLKDLLEEAKRRTILMAVLVLIVAYIMSLTSSSVWINLPVSVVVLAALRRLSFEVEFRWKPRSTYDRPRPPPLRSRRQLTKHDPLLSGLPCQVATTRWRRIIDSPVVEDAVDELTRSVIDEFITNLWYSPITSDQEVPEELRLLLNGVIAEVASRAKHVNLVTLLSQDVVDMVGNHFELFRKMKAKIGHHIMASMSTEERDEKLKHVMRTSGVLHPAVISPEAEYEVLKKLIGGVVALVLKRQDSHCRLLRTLARELLACAVLRPVLNFASPGYINELIESILIAKARKERQAKEKADESARQRIPDPIPQKIPSSPGLEMTTLDSRQQPSEIDPLKKAKEKVWKAVDDVRAPKRNQLPQDIKPVKEPKGIEQAPPDTLKEVAGNWAQILNTVAEMRAQILAPEHFDNVWTKGRDYQKRENDKSSTQAVPARVTQTLANNLVSHNPVRGDVSPGGVSSEEVSTSGELSKNSTSFTTPVKADYDELYTPPADKSAMDQYALLFGDSKNGEEHLPGIGFSPLGNLQPSSYALDNPKNLYQPRNVGGPELARSDFEDLVGSSGHSQSTTGTSGRLSSRFRYHHKPGSSSQRLRRAVRLIAHRKTKSSDGSFDVWNGSEVGSSQGLTSFPQSGENSLTRSPGSESRWKRHRKSRSPDVSQAFARVEAAVADLKTHTQSTMLHCQVLGAHFDRVGSKPFAIYTIRVMDTENRTWQIQRRFRNFEQLHRRLKDMPYYNLNLPPKRFLSSSLDNSFVKERCIILDKYLKDVLAIPSVAELHEVWDFLSENSQYYTSGNSVSMMRTLAVNVDDAVDDMFRQIRGVSDDISGVLKTATTGIRQRLPTGSGYSSDGAVQSSTYDYSASLATRFPATSPVLTDSGLSEKLAGASVSEDEYGGALTGNAQCSGSVGWHSDGDVHTYSSDSELLRTGGNSSVSGLDGRQRLFIGNRLDEPISDGYSPGGSNASEILADDLGMPQEWCPPKVSVPVLNLVEIIFQLHNRGWIRRQVLWMAKQILQLGMGDAIDVWLIGRIQWLRQEEVIASGIRWVTGILWPEGIFLTKHPRNLSEASVVLLESAGMKVADKDRAWQPRPPVNSFEYRLEAARRAGVVREVILEKAPAAVVNIIGRKQYAKCAKDIFYFLQSTVCIKQLTYCLLELLLTSAFPELHELVLDVRSSVT